MVKHGVSGTLKVAQVHAPRAVANNGPCLSFVLPASVFPTPMASPIVSIVTIQRRANPIEVDSISTTKVTLVPRMGCTGGDVTCSQVKCKRSVSVGEVWCVPVVVAPPRCETSHTALVAEWISS